MSLLLSIETIWAVEPPEVDFTVFEEVTGRILTELELEQIHRTMEEAEALNNQVQESPDGSIQSLRWGLGFSNYEFTVLVCGQFKVQADVLIPDRVKQILGKIPPQLSGKAYQFVNRFSGEIMPCLDPHTGISYLMAGGAHTFTAPTLLTSGFSVGLFFTPSTEKMAVGEYMFGRFSWNISPIGKWDLTGGADLRCLNDVRHLQFKDCSKFFLQTGFGFDISGAVLGKLRGLRQAEPPPEGGGFEFGAWNFTYGVIVNIFEFPWYERIKRGLTMEESFKDIDHYVPATNS